MALINRLIKNVPVSDIAVQVCDRISSTMYSAYPWQNTKTLIAPGQIPCLDGAQDYSTPLNIYRLTKGSIAYLSSTPAQHRELDVANDLTVDLTSRSYSTIRAISLQAAAGVLRLESAIQVPAGTSIEIRGEFQRNPDKIVDLNHTMWFDDRWAQVFEDGILFWIYRLTDDSRAGTVTKGKFGRAVYTGQLAAWMAGIDMMKSEEQYGGTDGYFPDSPLGVGRDWVGLTLFGW